MTLRKKILLSNIFMVIIPIIFTITIGGLYIYFNNGPWLKSINWAPKHGDVAGAKQNIIYLFETELSDVKWQSIILEDGSKEDDVLELNEEKIQEITHLGFHLKIASEDQILFSNMKEQDFILLNNMKISEPKVDGSLHWLDNFVVIKDKITINQKALVLTAVYNEKYADRGVVNSMVPMYMVSYTVLILFACLAVCSVAFAAFILSKWLNRSVDEDRKKHEKERLELIRGISHDLLSPLTSIRGYTEGILEGIADSQQKRKKYCEAILMRTSDMENLTANLADFVHLDSREVVLRKTAVNIVDYIKKALKKYTLYMENNNVTIEYNSKIKVADVNIDIFHMDRVFNNIIENTVKHRVTDSSTIKINLSKTLNEEEIQIEFLDNNQGVKEGQITRIFESFYRGNASRTKPEKGSGLGLAVVKSIINQHGGSVEAFLDNGLGIRIRLPIYY